MFGGHLVFVQFRDIGLTGNFLRIIYALSRSTAFKLLQVVLSYPLPLLRPYPYLLESLPCTLEVLMHVKKPEISLLGSEILFSVPVLTHKQDNPNKENVNTTRWARGVGHRSDYKSYPTVIHLGIYSHKVQHDWSYLDQ